MNSLQIGRIVATEKNPTTIDSFCFWTKRDLILNPFDLVKVEHLNGSFTYGVIQEISHITDAASYLAGYISNDFGELDTPSMTSRVGMNYVTAQVITNDKGLFNPVLNDAKVYLASQEEATMALGLDKVKNPVICGSLKMYEGTENNQHVIELPVKLDSRFVIGPEAAHLNISGISGLAAKTSYAMFLIKALQERVMQNDERIAFIIFNVKGKDLLAIDEPNDFEGKEMTKKTTFETYKKLGLTTKPFKNVQYLYPISQNSDTYCPNSYIDTETFNKQMSLKKTSYYRFEYAQDKDCLELLFADVDDPTQTMESILSTILSGDNNFSSVNSWDELTKQLEMIREGKQPYTNKEISILSWRKFFRYYKKAINANRGLFAEHLKTGQIRIKDKIEQLAPGNMLVIDIARLDSEMQAFVFGATMKYLAEYQLTEKEKGKPEKFIIFIDELNKFASNDAPKGSPILHQILDITERGRSLGLILFGAEQFKSALHTRVTGNCSTFIYGKTNSIELTKADYHYVPSVYKTLMTRLKPGQYIIQNSTLNSLLRISCPLPVYKQFKS